MSDPSKRTFNEEEVGRLLQLAIKQQEADTEAKHDLDHGLTFEEIQRIAAEAGIDEKYVRYALQNLHRKATPDIKPGFWGAPTSLVLDKEIPGLLNEDLMVEILSELRKTYKKSRGVFEQFKTSFEWTSASSSGGHILVQAQPVGNNTRITVKERLDGYIVLTHFMEFIILFIGTMISIGQQNPALFLGVLSAVASIFFLARWGMWNIHKRRNQKLSGLLENIRQIAESHHDSDWSYGDQTSAHDMPLIELDDAEDLSSEHETRTSGKTRT